MPIIKEFQYAGQTIVIYRRGSGDYAYKLKESKTWGCNFEHAADAEQVALYMADQDAARKKETDRAKHDPRT